MNIKKIKIFNNGSWVEYALDGTTIDNAANLEVGSKPGSTQTKDAIWNSGTQKDEENIIRVKDGDIIDGAIAEGFQSVAFGGKRYDKIRKNDNFDTSRKPTSAEGNQSFAAGASVHAHGDFSVAFGKDNDAHQRGGFVTGGGCRVGMTEEEFNAFYWDDVNNIPLNDGKGKNADGKITDFENKSYEQSYSFGFTSGTINKALGRDSFATGLGAQALGRTSFASGMGSKALGSESFAAGSQTYATGDMSAAFGIGVYDSEIEEYGIRGATGKCSFVAGRSANATGDFSQAFGYFTQATGSSSFAAGNYTEATGKASVSLGDRTKAIGDGSVALGYKAQAKGLYSFAMGDENTIVEGNYSSAFGRGLRTSPNNNSGQHIIGRWNDLNYLELMAFAVGGGSSDNDRKNLLTLYSDGRLRLPNVTGTLTDNDVTRLKDVKGIVNTEIAKVVDSAPETFDTLKEIADWIANDQTGAAAMANEIAQLKQDVDQVELDLASIELNTSKIIISNTVKTQYNIGTVNGAFGNPQELFKEGETLQQAFERIYTGPTTPGKATLPNLTLTLSKSSVSGEVGSEWPSITTSTSTTAGSYTYGPDTGVTWIGEANITSSGNTNGIFGEKSRTYTATQSYNAATAKAKDSMGGTPEDAVSISAGSDSDSKTVSETVLYRQFYGYVEGDNISSVLTNLKNVTNNSAEVKTYVQNYNPDSFTVTIPTGKTGYIYFITRHPINKVVWGPLEFPTENLGSYEFTNSYNKNYTVNVYRSNELNAGTYDLTLS